VTQINMGIFVRRGRFRTTPLAELPFAAPVTPVIHAPAGIIGLDGWPELDVPRLIKYRVDMIESALELVRSGLCAVFVPQFFAALQNTRAAAAYQLEERPLPPGMAAVKRAVFIVKRESSTESKEMRRVAGAIRQICKTKV
jgi:DNA-binding transcriptional LysR family regulator